MVHVHCVYTTHVPATLLGWVSSFLRFQLLRSPLGVYAVDRTLEHVNETQWNRIPRINSRFDKARTYPEHTWTIEPLAIEHLQCNLYLSGSLTPNFGILGETPCSADAGKLDGDGHCLGPPFRSGPVTGPMPLVFFWRILTKLHRLFWAIVTSNQTICPWSKRNHGLGFEAVFFNGVSAAGSLRGSFNTVYINIHHVSTIWNQFHTYTSSPRE